jgi:cytochrome b
VSDDSAGRIRVWDLPTRLFHWSLVLLVIAAFVSAKIGGNAMLWHGRCGLAILGLLTFRIVWGCIGSTYARFTQFVRGPRTILAYLRGAGQPQPGHNPLGALSVLALLGTLALQVATGLFANDDIAFKGYLAPLVDNTLSARITGLHRLLENLLLLLVVTHLAAIAFYTGIKKQDLVRPMISGWATGNPAHSAQGGGFVARVCAVLIALGVVWAASGALLSPPPAPPPSAGPDW